jgi:hypothetical protein
MLVLQMEVLNYYWSTEASNGIVYVDGIEIPTIVNQIVSNPTLSSLLGVVTRYSISISIYN